MTRIVQFQTNFSVGELDPLLRARTDLAQYQNALETAENVTIQPQGGARRRPGLEFVYNFGSSFTKFKLIPFEYSVDDSYLLVVVVGRIYIFKNGVLQQNINSSGNDYLAVAAITSGVIDELNYIQAVDTLILVHQSLEPQRLLRNTDTSWTVGTLTLSNAPRYAFTLATTVGSSYNTGTPHDHLEPSGIEGNITLTAKYSGSNANVFGASAASYIGQYINVTPFGRLRIVRRVSAAQLECFAEVPLFNTNNIDDADWEYESGYEDTWSNTRGWPRSAAFHEGRLYFGGTTTRPNTVWGSKVIQFFDFDVGTGLDDESVEATINTNQLNVITHLNPGPDLQIFTTAGEFVVAQLGNEPVTPTNFLVKPQSRIGSRPGVPIEDLKGSTIFVQRQGKSLMAFQFQDSTSSYGANNLSVFSSHLLKAPVDMSIRRATSTDETDRLFLVNGDDGSMTVYSILQDQNVVAPSKFTTDGDFIAIANEIAETFTVVKRTVNSAVVYYLEKFNENVTLDSAKNGNAASSVNMDHLEGKTVKIVRDGVVEPNQTVPASPFTVTFGTAASSSYQVGLNYNVTLVTMPAEPKLPQGTVQGVKKRIVQVDAVVANTQNLSINSKLVPFRSFGISVLGDPVAEFTGTKTVHGLLGFSGTGQITVTQTEPLKMTLLGLEYKMSVGN